MNWMQWANLLSVLMTMVGICLIVIEAKRDSNDVVLDSYAKKTNMLSHASGIIALYLLGTIAYMVTSK